MVRKATEEEAAASSGGATSGSSGEPPAPEGGGASLWEGLRQDLAQLRREVATFVKLRWDTGRVAAVEAGLTLAFGALALLALCVSTAVAAVLVLLGLVGLINDATGAGPWAGPLSVGLLFFLSLGVAWAVVRSRVRSSWMRRLESEYGPSAPGTSDG